MCMITGGCLEMCVLFSANELIQNLNTKFCASYVEITYGVQARGSLPCRYVYIYSSRTAGPHLNMYSTGTYIFDIGIWELGSSERQFTERYLIKSAIGGDDDTKYKTAYVTLYIYLYVYIGPPL